MQPLIVDCDIYAKDFGKIGIVSVEQKTYTEISKYLFDKYRQIVPIASSFLSVKDKSGFHIHSCLVKIISNIVTQNLKKAIKLKASSYLDQELNVVWTKTKVHGKEVFVRTVDEDLETLLACDIGRVNAQNVTSSIFAFSKLMPKYTIGNKVECFAYIGDEWKCVIGEIVSVVDDYNVTIKVDDNIYKVPSGCITKVFLSETKKQEVRNDLMQMYVKKGVTTEFNFGRN